MTAYRTIRRSAVLSAVAFTVALGTATAAQASGYDQWTPDQLAQACLSHGSEDSGIYVIPTTQVQEGSSGDCVAYAQYLLVKHGVPNYGQTDIDGQFGPRTNTAVRYQQQVYTQPNPYGLVCGGVDGQVGPETWTCLIGWNI